MEYAHLALQIILGICLSACAGLRAFLPLLIIGALQRMGYLQVGQTFGWIGSNPALIVFGTATLVEIVGDKVPVLDHTLDSIGTFVKPIAGTILFSTVILKMDPILAVVLGIIAGGSISELVHLKKATVRGGSTALTAGIANPFLSIFEDLGAFIGTALSIIAPILAFILLLIILGISFHIFRKIFGKKKKAAEDTV